MKKDERKRTEGLTSIIGGDASFDGTLQLDGSLRIDGSFRGTLVCGGAVTIGEQGSLEGDIQADELILGGSITGRTVVRKLVVFEASCEFEGELTCSALHVNEGAKFNGTSSMGEQAVERALNLPHSEGSSTVRDETTASDSFEPVVEQDRDKADQGFHFSAQEEADSDVRDRRS